MFRVDEERSIEFGLEFFFDFGSLRIVERLEGAIRKEKELSKIRKVQKRSVLDRG